LIQKRWDPATSPSFDSNLLGFICLFMWLGDISDMQMAWAEEEETTWSLESIEKRSTIRCYRTRHQHPNGSNGPTTFVTWTATTYFPPTLPTQGFGRDSNSGIPFLRCLPSVMSLCWEIQVSMTSLTSGYHPDSESSLLRISAFYPRELC